MRVPTMSVSDSAIAQIQNLPNLNAGQKNSLISKLRAAQRSLARGQRNAAINQLRAFINEVNALKRSHRLDAATAGALISQAQAIINSL